MKFLFLSIVVFLSGSNLYSQTLIKGKLVDSDTGEPISFGHVIISNKKIGVVSDELGAFTVVGADKSDTISFTSIGFIEKNIIVANINSETIKLERNNHLLDEVLILSSTTKKNYGDSQKKTNFFFSNKGKEAGCQILRLINTDCIGCRISKISFFIKDFLNSNKKIRLRIYVYDEKKQEPQTEMLNKSILINPIKKNSWIDLPLINDTLICNSKFILIGVEFLYNDDKVSLGLTNRLNECNTFMKSIGSFWHKPEFMKDEKNNFLNLMVKLELN